MICNKCGREVPNGSRICNFCGAIIPERAARHARPEPEEIYSFSDEKLQEDLGMDGYDPSSERTQLADEPAVGSGRSSAYDFGMFEERPGGNPEPYVDPREEMDDSYDAYQDGEDDMTFMDKIDSKFRRNGDERRGNSNTPWIIVGVVAGVIVIILLILLLRGCTSDGSVKVKDDNAKSNASATVSANKNSVPTQPAVVPAQPDNVPATAAPAPTTDDVQALATEPNNTPAITPTEAQPGTPDDNQNDGGDTDITGDDDGYDDYDDYDDNYDDGDSALYRDEDDYDPGDTAGVYGDEPEE